uniref:AIG1-type G domain-containing protein n=1 Tax=Arion vulgaris TaxID=1028688 RepID=A0A0B7BGR8_9EUPU
MSTVNLLLVGRTGNGKSSSGNSILGKKEFIPQSVSSSVIYQIKKGVVAADDKIITVVDGPGIGDSSTDLTDDGQSMIELTKTALSMTSNMFHALLCVFKYGVRFTKQEQDTVAMIKSIFGSDVIKNYGIIILSHGDSFHLDMDDEKTSFESWCDEQKGDIQALYNECEKRFVLFDNRSKDPSVQNNQCKKLMSMVTVIAVNREPYSEEDFKAAEGSQWKLLLISRLPELESQTENLINNVTKKLEQIGQESNTDHARNIRELEILSGHLQNHVDNLKKEDQCTGSIDDLLTRISITKTRITTLINYQSLKLISTELTQKRSDSEVSTFNKKPYFLQRILESIKSDPWSYRSLSIYVLCLSLFGVTTYCGIYRRKLIKMLLTHKSN